MMRKRTSGHHFNSRNNRAQSLVELLIATLIFAAVSTVLLSLYSINTVQLSQFWNKGDVMTSSSDALSRIGTLVRSARGFGENYGVSPFNRENYMDYNKLLSGDPVLRLQGINPTFLTSSILDGSAFLVSASFPALGDPYYSSGGAVSLPGTVYGGTWPMTSPPQINPPAAPGVYQLSQDTFIVQVPVFVADPATPGGNGLDPVQDGGAHQDYVWPATYNGLPPQGALPPLQAVDTYVFRVMPDPAQAGSYQMLECAFPACPSGVADPNGISGNFNGHPTNVPASLLGATSPLLVAKGIVGPLDRGGQISTFSYVDKVDNLDTTTPNTSTHAVSDFTGLIVNLEMLKNEQGTRAAVASFRSEFFVRNNAQVQMEGQGTE